MVCMEYRGKNSCINFWCSLALIPALITTPVALAHDANNDNSTYRFEIQAKPLMQALRDFTVVTGQHVVVQVDDIGQYNSTPVLGNLTAQQALIQLADNSGLHIAQSPSGAFLLEAQTPSTLPESNTIEQIVVVGSKTGETRQEIATSVGYFGEDQIKDQVIYNVEDAFDRTANVSVGSSISGAYSIRGVNTDGIAGSLNRSNALASILVNQVAMGVSAGNYVKPSLFDATSAEVLRGPQSSLQGPNALIGSVYINYNRPDFYGYEGAVRAEAGQHGTKRLALMQNVVLTENVLAARFVAETRQSDGDVTNITTGREDVQNEDENTLRLALRWRPLGDEDLVFDFTYIHNDSDSNATPFVSALPGGDIFDRKQSYNIEGDFPSDFDLFSLEASWQINERLRFSSVTGFNEFELTQRFEGDHTAYDLLSVDGFINEELLSQEFRLNYQGDNVSALVGLFYSDGEYNNGFEGVGVFPDGKGGVVPFNNTVRSMEKIEQQALFGQLNWRPFENWEVKLGARFNREERTTDDFKDNGFVSDQSASESFNQFIPSLTIAHDLSDTARVGASYSRGFQAGGISFAMFLGEATPYDEEFIDNYELFLRNQLFDGKLLLNANLFYFDWSDQQVTVTLPGGLPGFDDAVVNAGKSEVKGAEFEAEWQATADLNLFANIGFIDTEFKEFVTRGIDLAGMSFSQAPEFTSNIGGMYQNDNGFFASLTYSYTDKTYSRVDAPEITKIRDRNLLSGRVGYQQDSWRVYLWGNNLLDDDYELFVQDGRAFGLPGAYGSVGESRTLGAGFQLSW